MPNINLAELSNGIHKKCNSYYYSHLLKNLQKYLGDLGITFDQTPSNLEFDELSNPVSIKISILLSICSYQYLNPRYTRKQAFKAVLGDLESGYSERFTSDIFKAIEAEYNLSIKYDSSVAIAPLTDVLDYIKEQVSLHFKEPSPSIKVFGPKIY